MKRKDSASRTASSKSSTGSRKRRKPRCAVMGDDGRQCRHDAPRRVVMLTGYFDPEISMIAVPMCAWHSCGRGLDTFSEARMKKIRLALISDRISDDPSGLNERDAESINQH